MVDALEQADHFVFDADIGTHRDCLGPQGTDLGQDAMGRLFVRLVVDADAIPLLCGQ
ncbi:hypothetical protein D3C78_1692980 [compost metagenome]